MGGHSDNDLPNNDSSDNDSSDNDSSDTTPSDYSDRKTPHDNISELSDNIHSEGDIHRIATSPTLRLHGFGGATDRPMRRAHRRHIKRNQSANTVKTHTQTRAPLHNSPHALPHAAVLNIPSHNESQFQKLLAEKEKQLNIRAQKIENNNSWSTETEIIAAEIGEKAQGYVWMHNRNASYLTDWDTRYSNVEIILSILTGTSVFTTLNDCQELSLVTLVTGIIIYMTAVVRAIHQNRKYPERASAHRLAGSKYSEVYHSVQRQLALYRRDRENAKDYINWITEKFDTLLLSSPGMDDDIRDEYLIKFKNVKFMHPGDLKQIEIKKETPPATNDSTGDDHHPVDDCSSADFSSDTMMDEEMGRSHALKRSTTLRSPKVDKKMQYELARYTMR